jgi:hypothetical protein
MKELVAWATAAALAFVCSLVVSVVILGLLFVTTAGCGPSFSTTRKRHISEVDTCRSNEAAILAECTTDCRERIKAERLRCDEALAVVCNDGRRARKACRYGLD